VRRTAEIAVLVLAGWGSSGCLTAMMFRRGPPNETAASPVPRTIAVREDGFLTSQGAISDREFAAFYREVGGEGAAPLETDADVVSWSALVGGATAALGGGGLVLAACSHGDCSHGSPLGALGGLLIVLGDIAFEAGFWGLVGPDKLREQLFGPRTDVRDRRRYAEVYNRLAAEYCVGKSEESCTAR
jgi:hypothetical protein